MDTKYLDGEVGKRGARRGRLAHDEGTKKGRAKAEASLGRLAEGLVEVEMCANFI